MTERPAGRRRRLVEELEESGLRFEGPDEKRELLFEEIELALRPAIHERRVPSSGAVIEPIADPDHWAAVTGLDMRRIPLGDQPLPEARLYVDGLSSWLLRRVNGSNEWGIFDRPAGSERDLVVLADGFGATVVQRHPAGAVRIAGSFGVLRWNGFGWHHEPPVSSWIGSISADAAHGDPGVLTATLEFAVHDLGSMGIGSLLVYRPHPSTSATSAAATIEERLPAPPPVDIRNPFHLAPLRHALAQIDGAAIFDADGRLRSLGARLVPSAAAEETVDPHGGTRHTSARRYSRDDPLATVIAVSEDGPVTVFRDGAILGRSPD